MPSLPPDRSHLLTEQRNPRSMSLHALSVRECVTLLAREDRAVLDALDKAGPALTALIEAAEPGFTAAGRLIYFGAGTSGRLGVLDASEAPPTFQVDPAKVVGLIAGGDSALRRSSEGKEDDPAGAVADLDTLNLTSQDTLIGIAAGGTTPYVLGGLAHAKAGVPPLAAPPRVVPSPSPQGSAQSVQPMARASAGVPGSPGVPITALIVCTPIAKPAAVDHLIVLETGPEIITGSTRMKAGTATKLALNTISTTLMVRSGRVYENLMVDLRATNAKLRDRAARIVSTLTGLARDEAFALLDRAGGSVKTAVVMHRRKLEREPAEALLARCGQRLDIAFRFA